MATSKIQVLQKQFDEAKKELDGAAIAIADQLKVLTTRASKAELVANGFVIAIASPVPEGSVTHGTLADAHRAFQQAVQKIEGIRREARQVAKPDKEVKPEAKTKPATKKATAKTAKKK